MTNHYNIEIIDTNTHLKATYRDGKFKRLEHLRGVISDETLTAIGRIIPPRESRFDFFMKQFRYKIVYTILTEEKSIFSKFNSAWYLFYNNHFKIPPKFTGADGKALKSIITYLKNVSVNEKEALELWKLILSEWHTLNDFHQANTDLKYINSKLNIIINAIKKHHNTNATGTNDNISL